MRQLALEYGPRGIRVNAVAPGMIGGEHLPTAAEGYPLGRTGRPEEVAGAVGFLASPAPASSPASCCRSTAGCRSPRRRRSSAPTYGLGSYH